MLDRLGRQDRPADRPEDRAPSRRPSAATSGRSTRSPSSPDGSRIATAGGEGGVKVWDAATGRGSSPSATPRRTTSRSSRSRRWSSRATGRSSRPRPTRRSRPGRSRAVVGDEAAGPARLPRPGARLQPRRHACSRRAAASRRGRARSSSGRSARGCSSGRSTALHSDTVFGLRFSPDGTMLASAGADKFMKVTRVADGKEVEVVRGAHAPRPGRRLEGRRQAARHRRRRQRDQALGRRDGRAGPHVSAGRQAGDGRPLGPRQADVAGASGDKLVRFWNADNGGVEQTFTGPGDYVFGVATSERRHPGRGRRRRRRPLRLERAETPRSSAS